jgi:vancomycin resistance protein VanJ
MLPAVTDNAGTEAPRRATSSRLSRVMISLAAVVACCWCYGQVVRDRSTWEACLFYVPSPMLAAWCTLGMVISLLRRQRGRGLLYGTLALPALYFVVFLENQWWPTERIDDGQPAIRLVHWNVARGMMGWEPQRQLLTQLDADIVLISEVPSAATADDFPGYVVDRVHDMMIVTRGPQRRSGSLVPGGALQAFRVTTTLPQGELRLLVADMTSRITVSRDLYLRPMMKVGENELTDIIVGDLNAPRRSLALSDSESPFRHAYDAVGSGWGYTWPVPVPMLAIDQCLIGKRVQAVSYRLQSTTLSDHRLQCFDFRLKESAVGSDILGAARQE